MVCGWSCYLKILWLETNIMIDDGNKLVTKYINNSINYSSI